MIFLADESIDRPIVERLRQEGYVVLYIAELGAGMTDDAVLNMANQEAALLLTADRDFGEMVYRQQFVTHGVILIRLAGLSPSRKADIVVQAINLHLEQLPQSFSVISPGMFLIRRFDDR